MKLTESQRDLRLLGRRLMPHQTFRAGTVASIFLNSLREDGFRTYQDLTYLAEATGLPPEKRAALLLLTVTGTYPLQADYENVLNAIKTQDWNRAVAACARLGEQRKIELLTISSDVIDVTRYSAQRRISGIPRVVKNLAFSETFADAMLGVWEQGVLGIGTRGDNGRIQFSPRHWRRAHNRKGLLIGIYFRVARQLGTSTPGLYLLQFLSTRFLPLVYRFINRSKRPRFGILLTDGNYFLPESPDAEVSKRLEVWLRAFPEVNVRVVVHDMLPILRPEFFGRTSNSEHIYLAKLLARAKEAIVATEVLKREVEQSTEAISGQSPKVRVVPIPTAMRSIDSPAVRSHAAGKPYFVFFGGFEPRKALSALIDYLSPYPAGDLPFEIVILGTPWPEQGGDVWKTARRVLASPGVFKVLGTVTDTEMLDLIRGAVASLYLSHAEGYGLPILESLSLGKAVLTQDTPTNRELAARHGGVWHQFRFDSGDSLHMMRQLTQAKDPFEHLGILRPSIDTLPSSIEDWAREIRFG